MYLEQYRGKKASPNLCSFKKESKLSALDAFRLKAFSVHNYGKCIHSWNLPLPGDAMNHYTGKCVPCTFYATANNNRC